MFSARMVVKRLAAVQHAAHYINVCTDAVRRGKPSSSLSLPPPSPSPAAVATASSRPPFLASDDDADTSRRKGKYAARRHFIARVKGNHAGPPSLSPSAPPFRSPCAPSYRFVPLARCFDGREYTSRSRLRDRVPRMHFRGFASTAKRG